MLVADAYPNCSICGLPYCLWGDATDWRDLAHRTTTDLAQAPTKGRGSAARTGAIFQQIKDEYPAVGGAPPG